MTKQLNAMLGEYNQLLRFYFPLLLFYLNLVFLFNVYIVAKSQIQYMWRKQKQLILQYKTSLKISKG